MIYKNIISSSFSQVKWLIREFLAEFRATSHVKTTARVNYSGGKEWPQSSRTDGGEGIWGITEEQAGGGRLQ